MVTIFQAPPALLAAIAVVPAVVSWWGGRGLRALVDDPILPERLIAHQRRNGAVLVCALAWLSVIATRSLVWTLPLTIAAIHVAAFPLRRALFAESWTLAAYLSFFGRLYFGLFGFWAALAAAPALAGLAGNADWIAATLLAALLFVWHLRLDEILRICLRTRPLEEGPLLERCRSLANACGMPQPRFERVDLHGGVVANALAVPSAAGSSVLFTDTLLARLDQDEAVAICAHELGHLEYYNQQRLRRLNVLSLLLIAVAALWTPGLRLAGLGGSLLTAVIWLGLLFAAMAFRARDKQRQETACDVRAVALCGADPLISALTKLYTIARIPRRLERQHEQSATHPSLARRIRDIRKAAGSAPATLESAASFTSADGRAVATFEQGTVRWLGADAVTQTVDYANITELRVDARRVSAPRLVICGGHWRGWEMVLQPGDVARAQAVLDVVDSRLGEAPAAPAVPVNMSRPLIALVTMLTMCCGQIAVAVVALLACIRMAAPLLTAAGLAALTAAALVVRDGPSPLVPLLAPILVGSGAVLLAMAWSKRAESHDIRPMLVLIGLLSVIALASMTLTGVDPVRLHLAALSTPSAVVWLVALASALACSPARRTQLAGLAVVLAAVVTIAVASPTFLDRAASDPFLVRAPQIEWVVVEDRMIEEFAVPSVTSRLRFSPSGRYLAALHQADSGGDVTSTFHVGRAGQPLMRLAADDVVFADDDHLVVVSSDRRGTAIRKVKLGESQDVEWEQHVDNLVAPSLSLDRAAQKWRLTGWTVDERMARAEGIIGQSSVDEMRWPADRATEAIVHAFATAGRDALVVETRYDGGVFDGLTARWQIMLLMFQGYTQESRYWRLGSAGRTDLGASRLGADCVAEVLSQDALVCSVFDGTRTRIFSLNVAGAIEGLGWLDGRFVSDRNAASGWLSGWADSTPVAIRLATRQAFRLPDSQCRAGHVTAAGDRLAAVTFDQGGPKVRTYALGSGARSETARR